MANNEYMVQRSGASCIKEAYLLFINNIKRIFLNTWKPVLVLCLVAGLGTLVLPPLFSANPIDLPQSELQAIGNYASTVFIPVVYEVVCFGVFFLDLGPCADYAHGWESKGEHPTFDEILSCVSGFLRRSFSSAQRNSLPGRP
jgi:hypothetical protein